MQRVRRRGPEGKGGAPTLPSQSRWSPWCRPLREQGHVLGLSAGRLRQGLPVTKVRKT
jgi:hypothetical protein